MYLLLEANNFNKNIFAKTFQTKQEAVNAMKQICLACVSIAKSDGLKHDYKIEEYFAEFYDYDTYIYWNIRRI